MTPKILEIESKIQSLRDEKQSLRLPDIQPIEEAIRHNAARAVVDPQFKPTVERLIADKALAEQAWQRNGDINREVAVLESEHSMLVAEERTARLQDAERRYQSLHNEFVAAAKSICRLAAQMNALNYRNAAQVPGWRDKQPLRFDFPFMLPMGWQGVTSDMVRDCSLHWLNQEQKEVA